MAGAPWRRSAERCWVSDNVAAPAAAESRISAQRQRTRDPMATETNLASHPRSIVAVFIVGAVNLAGLILGWAMPVRAATLVVIGLVALATFGP